jgi:hypothetical protein
MEVFVNGDIDDFFDDRRGGKHSDGFYDMFPDLEVEARAYALDGCSRKSSDFTVSSLAHFINDRFNEMNGSAKLDDVLVRSIGSCRLDLARWGA